MKEKIAILLRLAIIIAFINVMAFTMYVQAEETKEARSLGTIEWVNGKNNPGLKVGECPSQDPKDYVDKISLYVAWDEVAIYDVTEIKPGHPDGIVYDDELIEKHCYDVMLRGTITYNYYQPGDKVYLTLLPGNIRVDAQAPVDSERKVSFLFRAYYVDIEMQTDNGIETIGNTFYVSNEGAQFVLDDTDKNVCIKWQNQGETQVHPTYAERTVNIWDLNLPVLDENVTETGVKLLVSNAAHETNEDLFEAEISKDGCGTHDIGFLCVNCGKVVERKYEACTIKNVIKEAIIPTNTSDGRFLMYDCTKCDGIHEEEINRRLSDITIPVNGIYHLTSNAPAKWRILQGTEFIQLNDNQITAIKAPIDTDTVCAIVEDEISGYQVKVKILPIKYLNTEHKIGLLKGESIKIDTIIPETKAFYAGDFGLYDSYQLKVDKDLTVTAKEVGCGNASIGIQKDGESTVYVNVSILIEDAHTPKDYLVTKADLATNGKIDNRCETCGNLLSEKTIYAPEKFTMSTTSFTYDGKEHKPTVTITDKNGKSIDSLNYTIDYLDHNGQEIASPIEAGEYKLKITFTGSYEGSKTIGFTIEKPAPSVAPSTAPIAAKTQKITIAKIKTVKVKTLKKKTVTIKLKAKASGKGKLTFKVTKYPKGMKKYVKVSKKGTVTLKKKAKKGTYKVKITAAANGDYKAVSKTISIKVK